jgi:Tfp pilus tip-associated adhesin PilY1
MATVATQPTYQITTNSEPNLKRSTISNKKENMSTLTEYLPSTSESLKVKDKSQMSDEELEKFYIEISL